jgi:hypothetical protein
MALTTGQYTAMLGVALERAWRRMVGMLFHGPRLEIWFGLGFCAGLSALSEGGSGISSAAGRGLSLGLEHKNPLQGLADVRRTVTAPWQWILQHLTLAVLVGVGVLLLVTVLWLVLLWLSSRGKFMFLAGVARNRSEVVAPWRESADLGNSLMLWRVGYAVVFSVLFVVLLAAGGTVLWLAWGQLSALVGTAIGCGLLVVALGLTGLLVSLALDDFVVPLMYRYQLKATAAWGYFLSLLGLHAKGFLLYVVMRVLIGCAVGVLLVTLTLLTCCCAGCLMSIPYIGTVLQLPVLVFNRSFSLAFLEQFHPDYRIMADMDIGSASAVAPGVGDAQPPTPDQGGARA